MSFTWKLSGEAGYGITTIGLAFTKLCTRSGFYAFDYSEFPSLIRGGFTTHELIFSDSPISTTKATIDLLVALRQDSFDMDAHRLTPDSIVLYDDQEVKLSGGFLAIPMPYRAIKLKHKAHQVMVNTVSIGASFAIFGWDFAMIDRMIEDDFAKKGQAVIDFNKLLAKEGWDHIQQCITDNVKLKTKIDQLKHALKPPMTKVSKQVMTGNDAFAYASAMAGAGAYTAYPMSPSSSVLATLAAWQPKTGMVVLHIEDEISAINQALGFAYAGVRVATGTSGGGFALMVEGLSYAGMAELPVVVFIAQRPGPATGLPTWTAQAELLFAIHAGHGEFPKIVLAPGDVTDMIELTLKAFDLADIYQTPVIILSDKALSESHESINLEDVKKIQSKYVQNRGKIVKNTTQSPYLRYKDSPDGISEMLIPGFDPVHHWQANSYEHREDSHTTEGSLDAIKQSEKRSRKNKTYLGDIPYLGEKYLGFAPPQYYGNTNAQTVFVCWGSTKSATLDAMNILESRGQHVGVLHFTHVYPLAPSTKSIFDPDKRYVFVENNSEAQLAKVIRMELGIDVGGQKKDQILRYDGRPILAEDIVNQFHSQSIKT
ncbi:MAG: 2-oxoacid:acceptor oxidoreductase subunit alpha [Candidatus Roizmanbacteria bacterium]